MTKTKFNRAKLAELQAANLPRMKASDLATVREPGPTADALLLRLDDYLKAFVPPGEKCECICCGTPQMGGLLEMLTSNGFKWDLRHGEGHCANCGYPARAMHYIPPKENEITLRNYVLQYHPDGLSFDKPKATVEPATKGE